MKRKKLAIASLVLGILAVAFPLLGWLVYEHAYGNTPFFQVLILGLKLAWLLAAIAGVVLGKVALLKARRDPSVYGGSGHAGAGVRFSVLALVPVLVALPHPFHHIFDEGRKIRMNEHRAISDIRTLIAAEKMYAT